MKGLEKYIVRLKIIICTIIMLGTGNVVLAQKFSNKGKEFWVGYGLHYSMEIGQANSQSMVLYLSAEQNSNVKVTIKGQSVTTVQNYFVPANTVIESLPMPKTGAADSRLYDVPPSYGGLGSDRMFERSIHIESDEPIVVYAHISEGGSSGATMLMPVESWGYSYVSVNFRQFVNGIASGDGCFSWMFVVANEDNTVLEINPSVPLRNGRPANQPFTVTLQRGQIYQVVAAAIDRFSGHDLTGTRVKSVANSNNECLPIAVFSGSSSTAINCNNSLSGFADNMIQQAFPVQAWGKKYLTAPFSSSTNASVLNETIYRIVVKDPSVPVYRNGVQLTNIVGNIFYEFRSKTADVIESAKPIMVAQYMPSMGEGINTGCDYTGVGDPEMIYLSPLEQSIAQVGFYRNTAAVIDVNYLTLIIHKEGVKSLRIDGSNTFSHVYDHPNMPGYAVVIQRWTAAKAQCLVKSDSLFTSVTYGLGRYDSYGYNAGTMINNLGGTSYIENPEGNLDGNYDFACINSPTELSILMSYTPEKLVWHLSKNNSITPNRDIEQNAPVAIDTISIKGVDYFRFKLPDSYQFTEAGLQIVEVSSTHPELDNCNNTEKIKLEIEVKDVGDIAAWSYVHNTCISDTAYFKWDNVNQADNEIYKWKWTLQGLENGISDTAKRVFPEAGLKNITLSVTTTTGCIVDSTLAITINEPAQVTINASDINICLGESVDLKSVGSGALSGNISGWYWDLGNGETLTTSQILNYKYQKAREYRIRLVGKVSALCISDTAEITLNVWDKPNTSFVVENNCLQPDGTVQFKSLASSPDGKEIASHLWNFGDLEANAGNPNTSNAAEPTHRYKNKTYTITYQTTSAYGCIADTTAQLTFEFLPELKYGPLNNVCINSGEINIATAQVLNGVTGNGFYKGVGVSATGNYTPSVAGIGKHTIWYIFKSNLGCEDSVSTEITVIDLPVPAFELSENVCLGNAITITDKSASQYSTISQWQWNLGNGNSETKTNNNPFQVVYNAEGQYTIELKVRDANGCESDVLKKNITIYKEPVVDFELPQIVCFPNGAAKFINQSQSNETLTYLWNLGDNTTSTLKNPEHVYTINQSYNIQLKATTAFGCSKTISKVFAGFINRPVSNIESSDTEICANKTIAFKDNGTYGEAVTYQWTINNQPVSTSFSFDHQFTAAGNYKVQLAVNGTSGCTSEINEINISVLANPIVNTGNKLFAIQGTSATFQPRVTPNTNVTYQWTPSALLSNANSLNPTYIVSQNQTFSLTVTVGGKCSTTEELVVEMLKEIIPPNAFSPNGDGINDTWIIRGLENYPDVRLAVFDRYGKVVLEQKGYQTPWDGTVKGKPLPVGTYYYIITFTNGLKEPVKGSVTIVR